MYFFGLLFIIEGRGLFWRLKVLKIGSETLENFNPLIGGIKNN